MGVPRLYALLNSRFKDVFAYRLNSHSRPKVQHMYLDANGIVYAQVSKLNEEYPYLFESDPAAYEHKLIQLVIKYIYALYCEIRPAKTFYITFDGVAPMAKIKHQRMRRFKSVIDRHAIDAIAQKHDMPGRSSWNTSAITPGTAFMMKLTTAIAEWMQDLHVGAEVVFSSCFTPGEGEHKLLSHLRQHNEESVIYGLDADLMFLALACRQQVYLLRETAQMDGRNTDGFTIVDMGRLKQLLGRAVESASGKPGDVQRLIDDIIVLCFMCGNDFLPCVPSCTLQTQHRANPSGLDTVLDCYSKVRGDCEGYLVSRTDDLVLLDEAFLARVLELVAAQEEAFFAAEYKAPRRIVPCTKGTPYDIDVHNYENMQYEVVDEVQLGKPGVDWRRRYYDYYCGGSKPAFIEDEYLRGIMWNAYYYFVHCPDWRWHYPHHRTPFASDLLACLRREPGRINFYGRLYHRNEFYKHAVRPLEHLAMVLPLESSSLLPATFRNALLHPSLRGYFRTDVRTDNINRSKAWQCMPMVDVLPHGVIHGLTSELVLTESERQRNRHYAEFVKKPAA